MRIDVTGGIAIEGFVLEGQHVHHISSLRLRGQLVRRRFSSMLRVGLASGARSRKAYAKAEGRRRGRLRQRGAADQEI
jgi:hypothetical protein